MSLRFTLDTLCVLTTLAFIAGVVVGSYIASVG